MYIFSERIQNEVTPNHDSGGRPLRGREQRSVLLAQRHQELVEAIETDPTAKRCPSAKLPASVAAVPGRSAARAAGLPGKGQSRFSKPQPQRPPPPAMLQELAAYSPIYIVLMPNFQKATF